MDEAGTIRLRLAGESDQDFLLSLLASTRPDLSLLDGPTRAILLRMQFDAQRAHYLRLFPQLERNVVLVEGQRAGQLCVARGATEIRLLDISLMPDFRRHRIGGRLLAMLQDESRRRGMPLRLHVLQGNSARQLYERHGFQSGQLDGLHYCMEWHAGV
jgi:ribosomal protein S18 acetylase RimI-like enzyme